MISRSKPCLIRQISIILAVSILPLAAAGCGPDTQEMQFLASWSTDGTRVALIPNYASDEKPNPAVFVGDTGTGRIRQIVNLGKGVACSHPSWSPYDDRILFAALDWPEGDSSPDGDKPLPYAVYVVDRDGRNLREILRTDAGNASAFLGANTVMWGTTPGTIVFQQAVGDKVTAVSLNLETGAREQFLPGEVDFYVVMPSPDHRLTAALLYDAESGLTRLYVASSPPADWRLLGSLRVEKDRFEMSQSIIFWSPDSSRFALSEKLEDPEGAGSSRDVIRVFEAVTGMSRVICDGNPKSSIMWDRDSSAFVFSQSSPEGGRSIFHADLKSGAVTELVPGGENFLLSWNHADNRIYFLRAEHAGGTDGGKERLSLHRLLSCSPDGTGARSLGVVTTETDPFWNLSPTGERVALYGSMSSGGILNLTSGSTLRFSLGGR